MVTERNESATLGSASSIPHKSAKNQLFRLLKCRLKNQVRKARSKPAYRAKDLKFLSSWTQPFEVLRFTI